MSDLFSPDSPILYKAGPVARVSINRAAKQNAITLSMWDMIARAAMAAEDDDDVHMLVVDSAVDGVFSGGADLDEFRDVAQTPGLQNEHFDAMRHAIFALEGMSKPTLCVVNGGCFGGGMMLALSCDLVIAAHWSKFAITPAKLGLVYPLAATRRLTERVGSSNALMLLYTGDVIGADRALQMGLLNEVHDGDDLDDRVDELTATIASLSSYSQRAAKRMVNMALDGKDDDCDEARHLFMDAYEGDDFKEGSDAFFARRPPKFSKKK